MSAFVLGWISHIFSSTETHFQLVASKLYLIKNEIDKCNGKMCPTAQRRSIPRG